MNLMITVINNKHLWDIIINILTLQTLVRRVDIARIPRKMCYIRGIYSKVKLQRKGRVQ